jgi:hypothetical protein
MRTGLAMENMKGGKYYIGVGVKKSIKIKDTGLKGVE